MKEKHQQQHWLRLVLLFCLLLAATRVLGQAKSRLLFPEMPREQCFTPNIIKGELPASSGLQVTESETRIARLPLRRNGLMYWEVSLRYDYKQRDAFHLRQQNDTVWLATDALADNWNATKADQRLPVFQASIREWYEREPSRAPLPPASLQENVFLRLNAQVGEEWSCFADTQTWLLFYRIRLEQILSQDQDTLYVFSVRSSIRASHMPELLKLIVSKTRGVCGMVWYDYACWEPYDCADLLVGYGTWK